MNKYFWHTGIENYILFGDIGIVLLLLFNLVRYKAARKTEGLFFKKISFGLSKENANRMNRLSVTGTFVDIVFMFLLFYAVLQFNKPFGKLVGTGANYFNVLFVLPVILILWSLITGANPLKKLDYFTLSMPIALFFAKIGCYCAGCCRGIHWVGGPRNEKYDFQEQFPVQLVEAGLAAAIFIILCIYSKKNKKPGTVFPVYMILYTSTRFFSEFYRGEENVLGPLKIYHILCLIGFVLGIIYLISVIKFGDKITAYYDKKHAPIDLEISMLDGTYQLAEEARLAEENAEAVRKEKIRQARNRGRIKNGKKPR